MGVKRTCTATWLLGFGLLAAAAAAVAGLIDFLGDGRIRVALDYLTTRQEVDERRLGFIGHSLAQSGHPGCPLTCPLSAVERTWRIYEYAPE